MEHQEGDLESVLFIRLEARMASELGPLLF